MSRPLALVAAYFLGAITMWGCASTWPYPYYATQMPATCYDQGTLLGIQGSNGWPDIALDACKPDPEPSPGTSPVVSPVLLKCLTMKDSDFYALKADDLKCHNDLVACQGGPPPQ